MAKRFIEFRFLSTLSLRRATTPMVTPPSYKHNFYPRSPCGERRSNQPVTMHTWKFLSTLSLRRATAIDVFLAVWAVISIHALLAESDDFRHAIKCAIADFYPRSPCGERHLRVLDGSKSSVISIHALLAESDFFDAVQIVVVIVFLSTLSLRRATLNQIPPRRFHYHFYPRSPCGERLYDTARRT